MYFKLHFFVFFYIDQFAVFEYFTPFFYEFFGKFLFSQRDKNIIKRVFSLYHIEELRFRSFVIRVERIFFLEKHPDVFALGMFFQNRKFRLRILFPRNLSVEVYNGVCIGTLVFLKYIIVPSFFQLPDFSFSGTISVRCIPLYSRSFIYFNSVCVSQQTILI